MKNFRVNSWQNSKWKTVSLVQLQAPPTSPESEPAASAFATQRRQVSAPFTGDKVRSIVRCFRCHRPRCLYSPKVLSWREKTLLEDYVEKVVFSCGSPVVSPTNFLNDRVFWKTSLSCDDAVETAFYASNLYIENTCHHCGETGEHVSVGLEHSNAFRLVLPVCKQCQIFGIEPKMLMPLSQPNSHKTDDHGDDESSLYSLSVEESRMESEKQN